MQDILNSLRKMMKGLCARPLWAQQKIPENYTELSVQESLLQRSSVTNTSPGMTEKCLCAFLLSRLPQSREYWHRKEDGQVRSLKATITEYPSGEKRTLFPKSDSCVCWGRFVQAQVFYGSFLFFPNAN